MLKTYSVQAKLILLFIALLLPTISAFSQEKGVGTIRGFDDGGKSYDLLTVNNWGNAWDIVTPIRINGVTNTVVFYDADVETAHLNFFNASAQLERRVGDFSNDFGIWTLIATADFNRDGTDELVLFNPDDGRVRILAVEENGSQIRELSYEYRGEGWDNIVPIVTDGDKNLILYYDRDVATAHFNNYSNDGRFIDRASDYSRNFGDWDLIIAVDLDDNPNDQELILYNRNGTGKILDVDNNGQTTELFSSSEWALNWDVITPVATNDSNHIILFHNREDRILEKWSFSTEGWQEQSERIEHEVWFSVLALDVNTDGNDEYLLYARDGAVGFTPAQLADTTWSFGRSHREIIYADNFTLQADGKIVNYSNPNEDSWTIENGILVIYTADGVPSTRFLTSLTEDGVLVLRGEFLLDPSLNIEHELRLISR